MDRLANELKRIFPDHEWIKVERNEWGHPVILTSFPMDWADDRCIFEEHRMGYGDECHPKLKKFMADHNLRCELQNSECLALYGGE